MNQRFERRLNVGVWLVAGVSVAVIAGFTAPRIFSAWGVLSLPLTALILGGIIVSLLMPVQLVPSFALAVYVLAPSTMLPSSGLFGAIPPVSAVLLIWAIRRIGLGHTPREKPEQLSKVDLSEIATARKFRAVSSASAAALLVWCVFTALFSGYQTSAVGWTISFVVGGLVPFLVTDAKSEARALRTAWTRLSGVIGAYAIVEFALSQNILYGALYSAAGRGSVQHWSVYRAEAGLGHPLFLGTFLAVGLTLAVGKWLESGKRSDFVIIMLAGLGLLATVSRGSLLAAALAIAGVYAATLIYSKRATFSRLLILAVGAGLALIGISQFDALTERSGSVEATRSSAARDYALEVALATARAYNWIGSGPGSSSQSALQFGEGVVIESSILQLLVSIGIPGVLLFGFMTLAATFVALRRFDFAAAGGMLAYLISISGYNAIDSRRSMLIFLGCLLILVLNPSRSAAISDGTVSENLLAGRGRTAQTRVSTRNKF